MRPLIGVACDREGDECRLRQAYVRAVEDGGGAPVILPQTEEASVLADVLSGVAGVVISGGSDVPPERYVQEKHPATRPVAPERDRFDFRLVEALKALDKPTLAICYGAQVLNVAFGGTLYQDIPDLLPAAAEHGRRSGRDSQHPVTVRLGTLLHRILGVRTLKTNSSHHQAIKETPGPLIQSAFSEDGMVEAVESGAHRFMLGVQWHPERLIDEELHVKLFRALVTEASK